MRPNLPADFDNFRRGNPIRGSFVVPYIFKTRVVYLPLADCSASGCAAAPFGVLSLITVSARAGGVRLVAGGGFNQIELADGPDVVRLFAHFIPLR